MLIEREHQNKEITDCYKNLYAFWKAMAVANSQATIEDKRVLFTPTKISHPILNPEKYKRDNSNCCYLF